MGSISKSFALILILIMAISSLIVVESAYAQTSTPTPSSVPIPKPSVPEFTLKYVDQSYYEQATYTTDPYTGKQVIANEGGYIKNDSVEITIKNQPFTSYRDASGNYTSLFYNIRCKGHFGNQWQTYPMDAADGYWLPSQSDYTVISLPNTQVGSFTVGAQMDFQVQSLIGYEASITGLSQLPPHDMFTSYQFHGAEGSWSNTQTITIGQTSASSSTSPTPFVPEFPALIILPLFAVVIIFFNCIYQKEKTRYEP
jgi:hypothetical protein